MPIWQVLLLLLAAIAALYLVLSYTNPRARAAQAVVGSNKPKCYPLADEQAVRWLGPENKAYSRQIATASSSAQTLFNLGMLAAHGFNQLEATSWFQVCTAVATESTPNSRHGLASGVDMIEVQNHAGWHLRRIKHSLSRLLYAKPAQQQWQLQRVEGPCNDAHPCLRLWAAVAALTWLQAALRADPACAMCQWGLAYAQVRGVQVPAWGWAQGMRRVCWCAVCTH